jgi:hypothetical protein
MVTLDRPLTTDELYRTIHKRGGRKAPSRDGISNEFFKTNLEGLKEKNVRNIHSNARRTET